MHMSRGPAMEAHLRSRPAPATAEPATGALIDRTPLKNEEPWQRGSGFPSPDTHTCGTEIDHEHCQQGNGARWEGSGVAASSAPTLLVPKTTTNAAEVRKSDLLMVTRPPPS